MKDRYLVGTSINLINLTGINNKDKININFKNGLFRSLFLNPTKLNVFEDYDINFNIAEAIITDTTFSSSQCFGIISENNNIHHDLAGSFAQGIYFLDIETNPISCFIWTIAHPSSKNSEFIEYNNLKYILSVKSNIDLEKGNNLIKNIDSFLK